MKVLTRSFIFTLVAIGLYASCSPNADQSIASMNDEEVLLADGTPFTRALLLEDFGACILSELDRFKEQSRAFEAAVVLAVTDPEQLENAQRAWRSTIDLWQQLEVMQIGPGGRSTQPGGQGLRDSIYAWPLNNSCAIDTSLVSESYANDASAVRFSANGLSAAEYLLFYEGQENACESGDEINTTGSWSELDESTLRSRRAAYAAFTAAAVAEAAEALYNAWSPAGENFMAELTRAGDGSRTYGKKRVAINAISDALFYVEWATKDNKLGRPLGITACDQSYCVEKVESRYGRHSIAHLRNNLIGFRKLFKGCGIEQDRLGFDDLLYTMGHAELAEEIDQAAQATISALDAISEEDLVAALDDDFESVVDVHSALTQLTDLLRSDFLIALRLELPQLVQGDND